MTRSTAQTVHPTEVQARQDKQTPARIRIPNSMVDRILLMPPERPSLDLVQAQLLRLAEASASQDDRILVTQDPSTLDLLRDWCTRLIADNRLSEDADAKQLVASASRVIGFMDNHETKAQRAQRHAAQEDAAASQPSHAASVRAPRGRKTSTKKVLTAPALSEQHAKGA